MLLKPKRKKERKKYYENYNKKQIARFLFITFNDGIMMVNVMNVIQLMLSQFDSFECNRWIEVFQCTIKLSSLWMVGICD